MPNHRRCRSVRDPILTDRTCSRLPRCEFSWLTITEVINALREILHEHPELRVIGDASNGLEAISRAHALWPDVILMDVSMPIMNGVEATRRIHAELPSVQIYGISVDARTQGPHAIEEAGAAGFFVKGADMNRLVEIGRAHV